MLLSLHITSSFTHSWRVSKKLQKRVKYKKYSFLQVFTSSEGNTSATDAFATQTEQPTPPVSPAGNDKQKKSSNSKEVETVKRDYQCALLRRYTPRHPPRRAITTGCRPSFKANGYIYNFSWQVQAVGFSFKISNFYLKHIPRPALLKVAQSLTTDHQRHLARKPYDPVVDPVADPMEEIQASLEAVAKTIDKFMLASTVANLRSLRARAPKVPWAESCVHFLEEIAALRRWKDPALFDCFTQTLRLLSEVSRIFTQYSTFYIGMISDC